jgi:hypothetical protein
MRTVRAVLSGFLVASLLILAGEWGYGMLGGPATSPERFAMTFPAALLWLLYTGASVVVGAGVATRMHDTAETFSAFSICQLFFGLGVISKFWGGDSEWYGIAAVLLVIPCAMIGRALARRIGQQKKMMGAA